MLVTYGVVVRAGPAGADPPVDRRGHPLEDRIAELLESKRELADAVVGSGEGWITELSDDELGDLVRLRVVS